jgi:hypothetical protein
MHLRRNWYIALAISTCILASLFSKSSLIGTITSNVNQPLSRTATSIHRLIKFKPITLLTSSAVNRKQQQHAMSTSTAPASNTATTTNTRPLSRAEWRKALEDLPNPSDRGGKIPSFFFAHGRKFLFHLLGLSFFCFRRPISLIPPTPPLYPML